VSWVVIAIATAMINLIVAELAGWFPWLAVQIVRRAARILPPSARGRYLEEWLAELEFLGGRGLSKLIFAVRLLLGARRVRRSLLGLPETPWWRESAVFAFLRPATDFLLLWGAVTLALGGIHATTNINALSGPLLILPPLATLIVCARGLYWPQIRTPILTAVGVIVSGVSVAVMAVAAIGIAVNGQMPPTTPWIRTWIYAIVVLIACRGLLVACQHSARRLGLSQRPVLILGAGMVGVQVAQSLSSHSEYGLTPVGFLDNNPPPPGKVGRSLPVLGTIDDLDEAIQETGARRVIVAFSSAPDASVAGVVRRCNELRIEVSVIPRIFDTMNDRVRYETLGGLPLLSWPAIDPKGIRFAIKHALGRTLALLLLIVFSPVMLCAAIAIRLSSPGPALFAQRRVGRDGNEFNLYKFRSMRSPQHPPEDDSDAIRDYLYAEDIAPGGENSEERRTTIGRILHRTSLDELPQLLNVLRGDMALVGPRPERPEFAQLFTENIARYNDRHRVKSGITGWAQVNSLHGQTSLAERIELDNYYITHWSLSLDVRILAMTLIALLRKRG
jgi:exopolysaccharide biosynthesis polyprenyl glycosylphosphotransferase